MDDDEELELSFLNTTSLSNAALVESILGPQRLPLVPLIPLTLIYVIIWCVGLVGNIVTCVVVAKTSYLRTYTNYYLVNLAITDILTLSIEVPTELFTIWQQYPWPFGTCCCILRAVISEATSYASVLTIVVFTTERYISICKPNSRRGVRFTKKTQLLIPSIWIISLLATLPIGTNYTVNYIHDEHNRQIRLSAFCGFSFKNPQESLHVIMGTYSILFFVIPMFLITFLYISIFNTTSSTIPPSEDNSNRDLPSGESNDVRRNDQRKAKDIVLRMLIVVVTAFFVCWLPFHAQRMFFSYISLYSDWSKSLTSFNQNLGMAVGILYYLNSCINPIIYCIMSRRYRLATRVLLCKVKYRSVLKLVEHSKPNRVRCNHLCYCNVLNSSSSTNESDSARMIRANKMKRSPWTTTMRLAKIEPPTAPTDRQVEVHVNAC